MLEYHIKKEVMRVGREKGKSMYYAALVPHEKLSPKEVEDRIIKATSLTRAEVRATVSALAEVVREAVLEGKAVDLTNLGTLKVVSIGKRRKSPSEITIETLKRPKIQFLPKHSLSLKAREIPCHIIDNGGETSATEV